MDGYLKISRKIRDWGWYRDTNTFRVFFHLLLAANIEDSDFFGYTIHRGQVVIGTISLSHELGLSSTNIRTAIRHLLQAGEITKENKWKYTIITMCHFDTWQCLEQINVHCQIESNKKRIKKATKLTDYEKMLKSPLWQKKKTEILERDNFTCQDCGSTEKTLHVHHKYYNKGNKPWEYPNEALVTLCEDCHNKKHQLEK